MTGTPATSAPLLWHQPSRPSDSGVAPFQGVRRRLGRPSCAAGWVPAGRAIWPSRTGGRRREPHRGRLQEHGVCGVRILPRPAVRPGGCPDCCRAGGGWLQSLQRRSPGTSAGRRLTCRHGKGRIGRQARGRRPFGPATLPAAFSIGQSPPGESRPERAICLIARLACGRRPEGRMSELRQSARVIAAQGAATGRLCPPRPTTPASTGSTRCSHARPAGGCSNPCRCPPVQDSRAPFGPGQQAADKRAPGPSTRRSRFAARPARTGSSPRPDLPYYRCRPCQITSATCSATPLISLPRLRPGGRRPQARIRGERFGAR